MQHGLNVSDIECDSINEVSRIRDRDLLSTFGSIVEDIVFLLDRGDGGSCCHAMFLGSEMRQPTRLLVVFFLMLVTNFGGKRFRLVFQRLWLLNLLSRPD